MKCIELFPEIGFNQSIANATTIDSSNSNRKQTVFGYWETPDIMFNVQLYHILALDIKDTVWRR